MMKFLRGRKGPGMSEYLIILALVAIATIGAVIFFADNVRQQISNLAEEIGGGAPTVDVKTDFEGAGRASYDLSDYTAADMR
jgi:pilus assembly protein Flp/PilA